MRERRDKAHEFSSAESLLSRMHTSELCSRAPYLFSSLALEIQLMRRDAHESASLLSCVSLYTLTPLGLERRGARSASEKTKGASCVPLDT